MNKKEREFGFYWVKLTGFLRTSQEPFIAEYVYQRNVDRETQYMWMLPYSFNARESWCTDRSVIVLSERLSLSEEKANAA
jgi:hypothetical protein